MMRTQVLRNFSRFYVLFNRLPGVDDRDETKRSLVKEISNGKTDDLKLLSRMEYKQLCDNMQNAMNGVAVNLDKKEDMNFWRKRVMASVGGWLKMVGVDAGGDYIKGVAVKAAGDGIKAFNAIPHRRLRELYFAFVDRQNALKRVEQMEQKEFDRIVTDSTALLRAAGIEVEFKIRKSHGDC